MIAGAVRSGLVERFGSPLYVYDLDALRASQADLRAALPEDFGIYYSLKANPHPVIARTLREVPAPCRAEVCSAGELRSALEAGYPAGEILYGGPGKTAVEIGGALAAGVRRMSVESLSDLRRVGRVATAWGVTVECLLRINAQAAPSVTSIRMTGTPSQFGIDAETLPEIAEDLLSTRGTRVVGAHFYPLSNSRDEESLVAEFRQSIELAASMQATFGIPMRHLDLGGGFAAPYAAAGDHPVYPKLRMELARAMDVSFPGWRDGSVKAYCESGRFLAGGCGELLTSVTNVKQSRGSRFLIMDAGINTFGGMAGLGRMLPLSVDVDVARASEAAGDVVRASEAAGDLARGAEPGRATLTGPLCTPGDLLGRNVLVPDLGEGAIVVIANAGAYGASSGLVNFLSRPAPAEIFLDGGEVVAATRQVNSRIDIKDDI
ncbi:diaminopimelate decarboxylase [Nakamurella sp. UYEF19]|uniref:type III PLP-dependent enzyme n=1 Tax=Nakamurella sp. UYEF19 TaxID=1756392 RepID=UPI003393E6F3